MRGFDPLTGAAGPLGIVAPGGMFDLVSGKKDGAPAVAAPAVVTGPALSSTTLLLAGGAALLLVLAVRR